MFRSKELHSAKEEVSQLKRDIRCAEKAAIKIEEAKEREKAALLRKELRETDKAYAMLEEEKRQKRANEFDDFCLVGDSFLYLGEEYIVILNNGDYISCHFMNYSLGRIESFDFNYFLLGTLRLQAVLTNV